MKAKTKHTSMLITIFVLLLIILYKLTQPQPVKRIHTRERVHVPVQIPVTQKFRAPPIKEYKPHDAFNKWVCYSVKTMRHSPCTARKFVDAETGTIITR